MMDASRQERARLLFDVANVEALERLRFTVSLAENGLKGLTLINGGAIIGLFTVLGSASGKLSFAGGSLWVAFGAFVFGLVFTLLANLCAFASQDRFYTVSALQANEALDIIKGSEPDRSASLAANKHGHWALAGAIGSAILALAAFVIGSAYALFGVSAS